MKNTDGKTKGRARAGASKARANAPEPVAPSTPRERALYELGKRDGEAAALRLVGRGALWAGEKILGVLFKPDALCGKPVRKGRPLGRTDVPCVLRMDHEGLCSMVRPEPKPVSWGNF